jgi:hypothetical protein
LLIAADSSTRRHVREHPSLFERLEIRGRDVSAWLRSPAPANGLLLFRKVPNATHGDLRTTQRVRRRVMHATTAGGAASGQSSS